MMLASELDSSKSTGFCLLSLTNAPLPSSSIPRERNEHRYELTPKDELIRLHVDIGLKLVVDGGRTPRGTRREDILACAIGQINTVANRPGGVDASAFAPSQRVAFARLNLRAGRAAAKGRSDFSLAETHLRAGLAFLPRDSWEEHYDLTLQLSDEYANVSSVPFVVAAG